MNLKQKAFKRRMALPIVGMMLLFCVPSWAQYTFKTFAAPKDGHDLGLAGINNAGLMVGSYYAGPNSDPTGVIVFPTGFKKLFIPTGSGVTPRAINNHNEVHGWLMQYSKLKAFVRFQDQHIVTYIVPGSSLTEGLGISDLGVRVGDFRSKETGEYHGFTWSNASGRPVFTIIDYPGAQWTSVSAINTAGSMSGNWFDGTTIHGFYETAGQFYALDYPGATLTEINGMNNLGEMVGTYCIVDECHGFSYFATAGSFQSIDVPGSSVTVAFGVNDLGKVVGAFRTDQSYGFVATPQVTP